MIDTVFRASKLRRIRSHLKDSRRILTNPIVCSGHLKPHSHRPRKFISGNECLKILGSSKHRLRPAPPGTAYAPYRTIIYYAVQRYSSVEENAALGPQRHRIDAAREEISSIIEVHYHARHILNWCNSKSTMPSNAIKWCPLFDRKLSRLRPLHASFLIFDLHKVRWSEPYFHVDTN